jgi:dTDP-4-amino-4,6-dideoxy-D-galactose acyltransferase
MHEAIEHLPWDSKFFGKRVGRLRLVESSGIEEPLREASRNGYEVLYVYSSDSIQNSLIGEFRFHDVGGQIRFTRHYSENRYREAVHAPEISEYCLGFITPELLRIALISGHLSRFKIDPMLPEGSFERLYETWLGKALERRPRSIVYTYMTDGILAGIITGEQHGSMFTIDLLAVLPSQQGRGIASMLIQRIQDLCYARAIHSIEVKTQLSNTGAIALYLRNDFTEHDRSFLYHAHKQEITSIRFHDLG